jgi:hypothetical protein
VWRYAKAMKLWSMLLLPFRYSLEACRSLEYGANMLPKSYHDCRVRKTAYAELVLPHKTGMTRI